MYIYESRDIRLYLMTAVRVRFVFFPLIPLEYYYVINIDLYMIDGT